VEEDAIRSDKQDADAKEADQAEHLPLPEVLPQVIQPHRRGHVHGLHHPRVTHQSPSTHQDQDIPMLQTTSPHGVMRAAPHPHARAQHDGAQLPVAVLLREPEATRRRGFGIELDQHRRLLAYHPGVMPRLHD